MTKILVIEDDRDMRRLVSKYLETLGFDCDTAENGAEGLEKSKSTPFDIVICDVNMPEMDGLAFIKQHHKMAPRVPIIMLSGNEEVDTAVTAMRNGATDFIRKERLVEELGGVLEKAISKREQAMADRGRRQTMRTIRKHVDDLRKTIARPTMEQLRVMQRIDKLFASMFG